MDPDTEMLRWFAYSHLNGERQRDVSKEFADLAYKLNSYLPTGREKSAGYRKLLEAKDCFVRASLLEVD